MVHEASRRMESYKLLALETSGRFGSVAAAAVDAQAGRCRFVAERELPRTARSAETLAPEIDALLRDAGWAPAELGAVAVAVGPGSFTGLRVGVTTAKTLAYATGAKLVAVDTLAALAEPHAEPSVRLWAALDAQRGEWFVRRPRDGAAEVLRLSTDAFAEQLQPGDRVVCADAGRLCAAAPDAREITWITAEPQATAVARLAAERFAAGETVDPFQLVPAYHRVSAAEEKATEEKVAADLAGRG